MVGSIAVSSSAHLSLFAENLFLDGQVIVEQWQMPTANISESIHKHVRQAHEIAALEAPGVAPALHIESAVWATVTLYWAASLFVDRAAIETDLPSDLVAAEPRDADACHQWSVDLAFRFLPSLIDRSQRIASEDGLSQTLLHLAGRWPLSSAGVQPVGANVADAQTELAIDESKLATIADNVCLRGILLDRIFSQKCDRLARHELFQPFVAQSIGAHEHLARWAPLQSNTITDSSTKE